MRVIDTNVLVRAIVNDDAVQSARAVAFLSENEIFIPVTVMLELEWVLRSRYDFEPSVIAQAIIKITALGNVVVGERTAVLSAANRAARGWDFAGGLHLALSEGCKDFTTLDKDLFKLATRETGAKDRDVVKVTTAVIRL
jgi:predicted nucleic-acid-binding protein